MTFRAVNADFERKSTYESSRVAGRLTASGAVCAAALVHSPRPSQPSRRSAHSKSRTTASRRRGARRSRRCSEEKETRTPAERKIDSQLLYARRMQRACPIAPGVQTLEVDMPYAADGHVIVDVRATVTSRLVQSVERHHGRDEADGRPDLQLHVDLDQIEAIAAAARRAVRAAQAGCVHVAPRCRARARRDGRSDRAARRGDREPPRALEQPPAGTSSGPAGPHRRRICRRATNV